MSELVEVGPAEDIGPGERRIVDVDGRSIGVFNIDGEFYALANTCLHEGGPVCEGRLHGELVGEYEGPGKRVRETFSDTPALACPWHGWEYDVRTGDHLGDPDVSLPTYDVVVDDGVVLLDL